MIHINRIFKFSAFKNSTLSLTNYVNDHKNCLLLMNGFSKTKQSPTSF